MGNYEALLGNRRIFPETKSPFNRINAAMNFNDGTQRVPIMSIKAYRALTDAQRLELHIMNEEVKGILGVPNLYSIPEIFKDEKRKKELRDRFTLDYTATMGLEDNLEQKAQKIQQAMTYADSFLDLFENPESGLIRAYRGTIGRRNEIQAIKDPIDLLLIYFSPNADPVIRYEAKRKLVLGRLALRAMIESEKHEGELGIFLKILNTHMWEGQLGKASPVEVVTEHDPHDYRCLTVKQMKKGEKLLPSVYRRYQRFQMREWTNTHGKKNGAYLEHRDKDIRALMLKLMRKGITDPEKVDDHVGAKLVFTNKSDIYEFLEKLQQIGSTKIGSVVEFNEISDTIANDSDFEITNQGSSKNLEIVKVHCLIAGIRVELQMHTIRTFVDSRFRDDIGFEEYAIKRLFETGSISLLYPKDVYKFNVKDLYPNLIRKIRSENRRGGYSIPVERAKYGRRYQEYGETDLVPDVFKIVSQLEEMPNVIIAVGDNGLPFAYRIANLLKGKTQAIVRVEKYEKGSRKYLDVDDNAKVLIVDDIGFRCTNIRELKEMYPQAKVAVIARKKNKKADPTESNLIDYYARELRDRDWLLYEWNHPGIEGYYPQRHGVGLIYDIQDGQPVILAEETISGELKLIGGALDAVDEDEFAAFLRELGEEVKMPSDLSATITRENVIPLQDYTFPFSDRDHIVRRQGFVKAFAIKKSSREMKDIKPREKTTKRYVWATLNELQARLKYDSYREAIGRWVDEIMILEQKQTDIRI